MVGNYDVDAKVEMAVWEPGDDPDPDEQYICTLEELYFGPANGELVLTFEDRDTQKFFDVSVSVKAVEEWNDFVNGLPYMHERDNGP